METVVELGWQAIVVQDAVSLFRIQAVVNRDTMRRWEDWSCKLKMTSAAAAVHFKSR
jgi:hypothetical protein